MRLWLATLLLCLLPFGAMASEPPDMNGYPGWHNRLTGYQAVREPRRGVSRQRAGKRQVRAKHTHRSPAKPVRVVAPMTLARGVAREIAIAGGLPENLDGLKRRVVGNPFIRGRLICAANVGAELARRGIRGTGSRLAMSYRTWGRASGPVPGAVAVFGRRGGGHVAIVHSVRPNGQVIYLNPSSRRQAWVIGPYGRRPIAYRVAG